MHWKNPLTHTRLIWLRIIHAHITPTHVVTVPSKCIFGSHSPRELCACSVLYISTTIVLTLPPYWLSCVLWRSFWQYGRTLVCINLVRFSVAIALGGLDDAMRYVRFVRCGGDHGNRILNTLVRLVLQCSISCRNKVLIRLRCDSGGGCFGAFAVLQHLLVGWYRCDYI